MEEEEMALFVRIFGKYMKKGFASGSRRRSLFFFMLKGRSLLQKIASASLVI